MTTALFLGATRKYHARQFPSVKQADDYLDELLDAEDANELQMELMAALIAAYMRVPKKSVLTDLFGQPDPDADPEEDTEEADSDAPKAPPSAKPRKSPQKNTDS